MGGWINSMERPTSLGRKGYLIFSFPHFLTKGFGFSLFLFILSCILFWTYFIFSFSCFTDIVLFLLLFLWRIPSILLLFAPKCFYFASTLSKFFLLLFISNLCNVSVCNILLIPSQEPGAYHPLFLSLFFSPFSLLFFVSFYSCFSLFKILVKMSNKKFSVLKFLHPIFLV